MKAFRVILGLFIESIGVLILTTYLRYGTMGTGIRNVAGAFIIMLLFVSCLVAGMSIISKVRGGDDDETY